MKKKITILISSAIVAGSVLFALPSIHAQPAGSNPPAKPAAPQPEAVAMMHGAIQDLEQAKAKLNKAGAEYGGHKIAAIKACNEAIKEIKEGLKVAEAKHGELKH